jgi:hypothetical protein
MPRFIDLWFKFKFGREPDLESEWSKLYSEMLADYETWTIPGKTREEKIRLFNNLSSETQKKITNYFRTKNPDSPLDIFHPSGFVDHLVSSDVPECDFLKPTNHSFEQNRDILRIAKLLDLDQKELEQFTQLAHDEISKSWFQADEMDKWFFDFNQEFSRVCGDINLKDFATITRPPPLNRLEDIYSAHGFFIMSRLVLEPEKASLEPCSIFFAENKIQQFCSYCRKRGQVVPCYKSLICYECVRELLCEFINSNDWFIPGIADSFFYYEFDTSKNVEDVYGSLMRKLDAIQSLELTEEDRNSYSSTIGVLFRNESLRIHDVIKSMCDKKFGDHPVDFDACASWRNMFEFDLLADEALRTRIVNFLKKIINKLHSNDKLVGFIRIPNLDFYFLAYE